VYSSGQVTAVATDQSQKFYPGVIIFNWYYLSSPPQIQIPLRPGIHLERKKKGTDVLVYFIYGN
jgi:hypothetical protein